MNRFYPGALVRLKNQSAAHRIGRRYVPVGAIGEVRASRYDTDGIMLLVKFEGFGTVRHTPAKDVELV